MGRKGSLRTGLPPVDRRRTDPGLGLRPDRADAHRPFCSRASSAARRSGGSVSWGPSHSSASRPGRKSRRRERAGRPGGRPPVTLRPIRSSISSSWSRRHRAVHLPGLPRFAGGAVGYAAYDAVRYTEHLPDTPRDDRGLPDLSFSFFDRMVLFDHIRKTILVVAQAHLGRGSRPAGGLRLGLCPGRRARRAAGRARPRADAGRPGYRGPGRPPPPPISPARLTSRSSGTARNTSRRETSFRSCPVSGSSLRPRPNRSTSTGCSGCSIPARSCST